MDYLIGIAPTLVTLLRGDNRTVFTDDSIESAASRLKVCFEISCVNLRICGFLFFDCVLNCKNDERKRPRLHSRHRRRIEDHRPETRELRSHIQQILAGGKMILREHVKPEMHQSVVELGTEICADARCARQQVVQLRGELATLAAQDGLKIASAGTHPFSHWMDQLITVDERYETIVKDMQQIARINLIFATRPRRNSGSRRGHRRDESGALFSATPLRALGQFAFLVRAEHRFESISADVESLWIESFG